MERFAAQFTKYKIETRNKENRKIKLGFVISILFRVTFNLWYVCLLRLYQHDDHLECPGAGGVLRQRMSKVGDTSWLSNNWAETESTVWQTWNTTLSCFYRLYEERFQKKKIRLKMFQHFEPSVFFKKTSPERVTRSLPVALSLGITAPPPASTNLIVTSSRNPVLESGEERGTEKGEVWKRRKRSGPLEVTGGTWPPRQNLISCGSVWTNPEPGDPEPSTMVTWSPTPSHSAPTPRLESVCDWLKLKYKLNSDWSLPDHTSPWLVHQSKLCQNPADWWWQEPEKENLDFLSSFLCK